MMSAKALAQLAKKWQRVAAIRRRRLTWLSSTSVEETEGSCGMSCLSVAGKGYCVVYTADGTRFEVPLAFLGTKVFSELLRMSQEEFGFAGTDGGRITLPCDASEMEYAMCMLRRSASAEMESAFLSSMATPCHYQAEPHLGVGHHFGVCSSWLQTNLSSFLSEKNPRGCAARCIRRWQSRATVHGRQHTV